MLSFIKLSKLPRASFRIESVLFEMCYMFLPMNIKIRKTIVLSRGRNPYN